LPLERAIFALAFSVQPLILANMVHFTLDTGLFTFVLWFLVLTLDRRHGLALVAATLMLFTKETAMLLVPIFWTFALLLIKAKTEPPLTKNWAARAISFQLFVCFVAYKLFIRDQPPVFIGAHVGGPLEVIREYFDDLPMLTNFWALIGVLNLAWLLWGLILAICIVLSCSSPYDVAYVRVVHLCFGFAIIAAMALTLVRPVSNARYVINAFPLLFLGLAAGAAALLSCRARILWGVALLALNAVACVRTVDPVSRALFTTFPFGDRSLLRMTSRTGECCGYGRDQLVYNLQYLYIPRLISDLLKDSKPARNSVYVCEDNADWKLFTPLTVQENPWNGQNAPPYPRCLSVDEFRSLGANVKVAYFVEFPNFPSSEVFKTLGTFCNIVSTNVYQRYGYRLRVVAFERR
jgi:hypothetical protein